MMENITWITNKELEQVTCMLNFSRCVKPVAPLITKGAISHVI